MNCLFPRFLLMLLIAVSLLRAIPAGAQQSNPAYDKALADSLGADAYGMKKYVLVILKKGPATISDGAKARGLFHDHLQNIKRLAGIGKLVLAGPVEENPKGYEGIFILNVATTSEATALLATDPAVKAGLLATELHQWYGSAALPLYLKSGERIRQKDF